MFTDKKIVVGVSGGIAAYKACEIVSWLRNNHAQVQVLMTANSCNFVSPMTFTALAGNPALTDLFDSHSPLPIAHIAAVQDADLMLIVPATANIIAKAAAGLADDLLSSALLAASCPVLLAPAMNVNMFRHPATTANLAKLKGWGYKIIEPGIGRLACGTEGKGRLADLPVIQNAVCDILLKHKDFIGRRLLVTAGPTREAIDPVRFISNRSSGKMGYAIAKAAAERGAEVCLISGPVALTPPLGVRVIMIQSAEEMYCAVLKEFNDAEIIIKAAAVADYRPGKFYSQKIKKQGKNIELELVPNTDILLQLGKQKEGRILVGFAAESEDITGYAQKKLAAKNLDMIVANDITRNDAGFDANTNAVTLITPDGCQKELPLLAKDEVANLILDKIKTLPAFSRL